MKEHPEILFSNQKIPLSSEIILPGDFQNMH